MESTSYTLRDGGTLLIREARQEDATELLEFLPLAFEETDFLLMTRSEFDRTLDKNADFLGKISASKTQLALVAHLENRLVGVLTFTGRDLERVRHAGEVGLIVGKEYWGRGIGRNLMKQLHLWAKQSAQISKIDLRVRLSNQRAINLYEGLGYQIEGWIRKAVKIEGEYDDHYWMGKEFPFDDHP